MKANKEITCQAVMGNLALRLKECRERDDSLQIDIIFKK